MSTPGNESREALNVLNKYYSLLANQITDEINQHREDFQSIEFGSRANEIIEKHAQHIRELGSVYSLVR